MSNEATILRIRAQVENLEGLNRARSAVRNFATESKAASNDLGKLRGMFKELGAESLRSVNNLKNYRTGLDALRQSAEIGSTTFNELTLEIKQLDNELGALQGKQNDVTQGFNRITRATNAAAAAQRSYNGLIRNPLTGAYGGVAGGTQYGAPIGPVAPPDYAGRIAQQQREASAQSAREARRAQKMQAMASYYGTDIGTRDPATGAMIAGGYQAGPFPALPTQAAPSRFGLTQRQAGGRMNFGSAARGLGAVAAGGVFGGPEGAAGGLIGLGFGGPAGAAAGAAIGATVGMLRQALGATAAYAAELEKQRIALRQVIGSQDAYNKSLEFIGKTSADLAIPQDIVLKNFTRLSASVIGAGGNVKDAEKAFKGITAGILGTGGSLENLDAALLATAQVFSKGKVSAEELRGQIGERLPGAFTLFAESVKMTPQELDKALQEGKVTLLDFQKFAEKLFKEYGQAAELIARSPENAGNRLKTTLANLSESVGTLLKPIGTAFQNTFADIFKIIDAAVRKLNEFLKIDEKGRRATLTARIATTEKEIATGQGYLNLKPSKTGANYIGLNRTEISAGIKRQQAELQAYKVELAGLNAKPQQPGSGLGTSGGGNGGSAKADRAAAAAAKREKTRQERIIDQQKAFAIDVRKLQEYIVDIQNKGAIAVAKPLDAIYLQYVANTDKIAKDRARLTDVLQKRIDAMTKLGAEVDPQKAKEFRQAQDQVQAETMKLAQGEFGTAIFEQMSEVAAGFDEAAKSAQNYATALRDSTNAGAGFREGANAYVDSLGTLKQATSDLAQQGFQSLGDAITGLAFNGTANFREFAAGILKATAQMIIQQFVLKAIMQAIGFTGGGAAKVPAISGDFYKSMPIGNFTPSAYGNVFGRNGIQKFAMGGVVNKPTIFPFANGTGLMGEAGPEAIMPLQRAANGKLGVIASGGGSTSVVVNVDASGNSSVQGDQAQGKQLGLAVSAAVQAELIKQQRPGGLLANTRS
jgi:lambda family phage tail tape measure protein